RHTRFSRDWSSDVCSSDLAASNFSFAIGPYAIVVDDDHARLLQLLQHFIQTFPSFRRQLADKPVDLLGRDPVGEMDAAVTGKVFLGFPQVLSLLSPLGCA